MKLLLISNSTNAGEEYLKYPINNIKEFLRDIREVLFVPYAAVSFSYDEYLAKVQARFDEIGVKVTSVHQYAEPIDAVIKAKAVVVGGGNTFALAKKLQEQGLIGVIRGKVEQGMPYIGWSAGSNVACPTICTTNDMPIVQPESFRVMGAVKFQINPHYLDHNPEGHAGETREQRIEEYIAANSRMYVVGLREGCMLKLEDGKLSLIGSRPMRIFKYGQSAYEVKAGDDLDFLMQ